MNTFKMTNTTARIHLDLIDFLIRRLKYIVCNYRKITYYEDLFVHEMSQVLLMLFSGEFCFDWLLVPSLARQNLFRDVYTGILQNSELALPFIEVMCRSWAYRGIETFMNIFYEGMLQSVPQTYVSDADCEQGRFSLGPHRA